MNHDREIDQERTAATSYTFPTGRAANTIIFLKDEHQPKHMKRYSNDSGHCCFAGCTPMGCPGGCCVNGFGHREHCSMNTGRQMDDVHHDIYVTQGMRRHLYTGPMDERES